MAENLPTAILIGKTIVDGVASIDAADTAASNYSAQAEAMRYNARQERIAAEMAYGEGSLNASMVRMQGRENIASGVAAMGASGNVGTSAQSAIREGAFNLDKDLAAIRYRYYNEAIGHKNQAIILEHNARIMEKNARDAKISGFLGAATSVASNALGAYQLGFLGSK